MCFFCKIHLKLRYVHWKMWLHGVGFCYELCSQKWMENLVKFEKSRQKWSEKEMMGFLSRWRFQIFLMFTPKLWEDFQFDEHIFQMGWNHQPVFFWLFCFHLERTAKFLSVSGEKHVARKGFFVRLVRRWREILTELKQPKVYSKQLHDEDDFLVWKILGKL